MNTNKLKNIIKKIFINHKLSNSHAIICANALINAELVGAPSHGLSRLKMYCDRINKKVINPKPKIKIKIAKETAAKNITTYIANGKRQNVILDIMNGKPVGTKFTS